MNTEIEILEENGVKFIRPKSDLYNLSVINEFGEMLTEMTKNKAFKIVLDLSDVSHIDSVGLGHIVKMCVIRCSKKNVSAVFCSKFQTCCTVNCKLYPVISFAVNMGYTNICWIKIETKPKVSA